jgi:hypothetical protein
MTDAWSNVEGAAKLMQESAVVNVDDIKRSFDLNGMRAGEWFFGCKECWFQVKVGGACVQECPKCYSKLFLLDVTEDDVDG